MKKLLFLFLFLFPIVTFSQIKGLITDAHGVTLPSVTVFIENSYNNTTSNESGLYELNVTKPGKYTVIFQYLGFKAQKIPVFIESFPYVLNVKLAEEKYELKEVLVSNKENPAKQIIKNAIAAKKGNSEKTAKYKADFYSRGLFRIKDAPKKILGQDIGDFDGMLDSTRTGILYLSETVSKLQFQKPNKMKETIVASKVSGKDNGFSFNNAADVEFDFYENYIPFQVNIISPISDNAFSYYKFKFDGTFTTQDNQLINKIKVIPLRDTEPVVEGEIYIVEDSWAIYAIDVSIKGYQMQTPAMDTLLLKQNFTYNAKDTIWTRNTQSIDFAAGILGINLSGRFTYVYSNFEFEPQFEKKTFTREVLTFEKEANKKDDSFWNTIRPIPLTIEESTDYVKKDSIQTLRKSQKYLDSIDRKGNKFKIQKIISGYTYKNSFEKWSFNYKGPLTSLLFNTVQGYHLTSGFSYLKEDKEQRTETTFGTLFNYGFADEKFRGNLYYSQKFNNTNYAFLSVAAGNEVAQFNAQNPISGIVNSVSTLFFKNNFMKLYDKSFVTATYSQEVANGVFLEGVLNYSERKPLWNTTNHTIVKNEDAYTSNNPLLPFDYNTSAIIKHNLAKGSIRARFKFGQEYWSRPDGKFNIPNGKYPTIHLVYEKGFAGNKNNYNFDFVSVKVTKDFGLGNKGVLAGNLNTGKFFNAKGISFVDYKHFNGNQTHIGQASRYLNSFNLMSYYGNSTHDEFIEFHSEYDDKGFLINKIPLLNKLKTNLIFGFHNLSLPSKKPYQEASVGLDNLGFGKFKVFRFDYVRSYQSGFQTEGVVFGLKILNALD
ncbi:MAG: carboxypeptidase-like regulatory domain-containing protein [Flavobacterium sp.]|nr:carboxypeptidase-like regulatory domain-containing protein [Flavobacterium sp.]